ncbi:unnamed protein product [Mytilus coruscus]|uniref:Uncharacterized protein n=1 Tax=Mytilus coruscus TaxID=42192 RepID=A0A6J8D986_MYTCO|nr:unnamed protein product [Mytilus coruscus]
MPNSDDNEMSPVYALEDNVDSVKLRPKRKTAKVLVYEDDNEMEVSDSREMSPVIVLEDVVLNSSLLGEASVLMENMDFYDDPTDKEPTEASKNQEEQPEHTQKQSEEQPTQPEETSEHFKVQPEVQPEELPEVQPEKQPEVQPEQPEKLEVRPEVQPEQLEVQPEVQPEQLEEQPEVQPEVQPQKQPEVQPEVQPEEILSKGDFVLVELQIEKTSRTKQFIGKVISIAEDDVDVSFMKKNQNGMFIWPEMPDPSLIERKSIIKKLQHPKQIKKRRSIEMFFQDTCM